MSDYLWENKVKAVGTRMSNKKGLPKNNLVKKRLKRDEYVYMRRNHLLYLKWKDTGDVLMLSTCHKATATEMMVRSKTDDQMTVKEE